MSKQCTEDEKSMELSVSFNPPLYLQRRAWIFEVMRRERVTSALDVGCGEGEIVACLCNPAPWLSSYTIDATPQPATHGTPVIKDNHLHLQSIHALDISLEMIKETAKATSPSEDYKPGYWHGYIRWEPLDVKLWQGGLESYNPDFVGIDCIICTEVIEHLPEEILHEFAPMLFGVYHPRVLLVTTPSYTFNARFTAPDAPSSTRKGYLDPTGRTTRIFRHDDHKFEWTVEEFAGWCRAVADEWGYDVEVSGVGKAQELDKWGRDKELGYASQVATFKRRDDDDWESVRQQKSQDMRIWNRAKVYPQGLLVTTHRHEPHPGAGHAGTLREIGEVVESRLKRWNTRFVTLHELWFEHDISQLCGGSLSVLIEAVDSYEELGWYVRGTKLLECDVEWKKFVEEEKEELQEEWLVATTEEHLVPAAVCEDDLGTWGGSWSQIPTAEVSWHAQITWGSNGENIWDTDPSLEGWGQSAVAVKS